MKRKDKVTSVKLSESSLLIKDRAGGDFSAGFGVLFDGFQSIQVMRVLLSHEVNDRICSLTQGAQDLVIIEARGAFDWLRTNGANSSLRKGGGEGVGAYSKPDQRNDQDSPPPSVPANEQVIEREIEALC